jgi:hypothetical protein
MLEKLDSALPNKNDDYQEEVIYNFSTASMWHSCPLCSLSIISASSLDMGNCPMVKCDSPSFSNNTFLHMSQINCCTINLWYYTCLIISCLQKTIIYFASLN